MTIIASATEGRIAFHLPAGAYHVGEVTTGGLLKDRFSYAYREMTDLTAGLVSCGNRMLVVANVFEEGAIWEHDLDGEPLTCDRGFVIAPIAMIKTEALDERSTFVSSSDVNVEINPSKRSMRIGIDGTWRRLIDDAAPMLGRTRGHSIRELARAFDRVRNRTDWTSGFETTLDDEPSEREVTLIGHAIEFFTGEEPGIIEGDDGITFISDGVDCDLLRDGSQQAERVEQAAALLRQPR